MITGLRSQVGPKPTRWLSLEIDGALLVGDYKAGKWDIECDQFPDIEKRFQNTPDLLALVNAFYRRAKSA